MIVVADLIEARSELQGDWLQRARAAHVVAMRHERRTSDAACRAGYAVHAIGIGPKEVGRRPTPAMALRFYVVQKIAKRLISRVHLIPPSIDGIPVDVIESPPAFVRSVPAERGVCRPVMPGISVGRTGITFGTIAAFARSDIDGEGNDVLLLSNSHILGANEGEAIFQPGLGDSGGALNQIGSLLRAFPIEPGSTANQVDAAVARLHGVNHQIAIPQIGRLLGVGRALQGTIVCKFGRTTGYTEGVAVDLNYSAVVGLDVRDSSRMATFVNQIRIDKMPAFTMFADAGDSGSLLMEQGTARAVGLYFAGPPDGRYGLANHILSVTERLHLSLLTSSLN